MVGDGKVVAVGKETPLVLVQPLVGRKAVADDVDVGNGVGAVVGKAGQKVVELGKKKKEEVVVVALQPLGPSLVRYRRFLGL